MGKSAFLLLFVEFVFAFHFFSAMIIILPVIHAFENDDHYSFKERSLFLFVFKYL
jgi:hypothetical protein